MIAYLTPPYLTAIAFVNLFSPNAGLVNRWLRDVLGLPALTFNVFSMAGLVLVTTLHTFPFVYLLAASALRIGRRLDGGVGPDPRRRPLAHGARRSPRPLVAPAVLSGRADRLRQRDRAVRLAGHHRPARRGSSRCPRGSTRCSTTRRSYGLASALSLVFVAITVVALALQRRYLARRSLRHPRRQGQPAAVGSPLGPARWGCSRSASRSSRVAVLAPYLTLLAVSVSRSWGLDFWQNLTLSTTASSSSSTTSPGGRSATACVLAAAAATLTVLLGSLIGWVDLRTRLPGRKLLDYASLVPLGLPGIVMAVALIQFWLRVPVPIYGTLLIILLAYSARYVPLAVRSANAAFRQIDPSLEETARVTGAGWLRTFGSITLPLARPGLFAGLAPRLRAGHPGAERVDPALQLAAPSPWRWRSTTSTRPGISARSPRSPS